MMKRLNKRGFSLIEVIMALAVVVIVSVAALSITLSSVPAKLNAMNKTRAQNFAADAWECFKVADGEDDFLSLLDFAVGVTEKTETAVPDGQEPDFETSGEDRGLLLKTEHYGDLLLTVSEDGSYVFTSERFNFIATVSVDYPAAGGRPTLFYISVTNGDLEEIVTLSYGKEGEA